jgi:hypothetical protein
MIVICFYNLQSVFCDLPSEAEEKLERQASIMMECKRQNNTVQEL